MKNILYTLDDGRLAIVAPSNSFDGTIEELAGLSVPHGIKWQEIDSSDIPTDRHFRDAWVFNDGLSVDIEKAREVQKEHIRETRKPLLEALDIRQLRGEDVEAEKQALRDLTDSVEGVTDIDKLKNIIPEGN